jgi:hypothetical protein
MTTDGQPTNVVASTVEAAWDELLHAHQGSHVHRRTSSRPGRDLFYAVDERRRPGMLVLGPSTAVPRLPALDALDLHIRYRSDGTLALDVALNQPSHRHLFAQLFAVITNDFHSSADPGHPISFVAERLARWQQFLQRGHRDALSAREQLGLWGELATLRYLMESRTANDVVAAWKGPTRDAQDFRFASIWIECKTIGETDPDVAVSSLEQLQPGQVPLFLLVHIAAEGQSGLRLIDQVTALRELLADKPGTAERFEKLLRMAGYDDEHSYPACYSLVGSTWYRVAGSFPRLNRLNTPSGISDARYRIRISALADHAEPPPRTGD